MFQKTDNTDFTEGCILHPRGDQGSIPTHSSRLISTYSHQKLFAASLQSSCEKIPCSLAGRIVRDLTMCRDKQSVPIES